MVASAERNNASRELQGLLAIQEESAYAQAADSFLAQRLEELSLGLAPLAVNAGMANVRGFIGPDTVVSPFGLGLGYKIDDPTPYRRSLDIMRPIYEACLAKGMDPQKAFLNAAIGAAQYSQEEYFGCVRISTEGKARRDWLLGDFMEVDAPASRSISEFVGAAECAERAFLAHNILKIADVECVAEIGRMTSKTGTEPHVYLLVPNSEGRTRLFDPQNPILTFDVEGKPLSSSPFVRPAEELSRGAPSITVDYPEYQIDQDGERSVKETQMLTYYSGDFCVRAMPRQIPHLRS